MAQAVAIMPGISRSGATISTALLSGIKKEEATRFSFLMVLLPIIGASLLDILDLLKNKRVLDAKMHRTVLLEGYKSLVAYLQQKKIVNANEAKQAMKNGLDYLLPLLAK